MKKLYLAMAAALLSIASMSARELTFYLNNTPIANGETVKYELSEDEVQKSGDQTYIECYPNLSLHADLVGSVDITATCTTGQTIGLCAGGACVKGTEIVKENVSIQGGTKLPLNFDYEAEIAAGENIPQVITEFKALYHGKQSTLKTFTFIINPTAGLATVIADDASFRAVKGGIEYNLDAPAAVALYSITGQKVLTANLNGTGTLSTANLPAGIYVYTLNGHSSKIYLR